MSGDRHRETYGERHGGRGGDWCQPGPHAYGTLARLGKRAHLVRPHGAGLRVQGILETLLGPGHDSSPRSRPSAARARAAVDFTGPVLMPSTAAISASDRPR